MPINQITVGSEGQLKLEWGRQLTGDWKRPKWSSATARFSSRASGANPRFWICGSSEAIKQSEQTSPNSRGRGFYPHTKKMGKLRFQRHTRKA